LTPSRLAEVGSTKGESVFNAIEILFHGGCIHPVEDRVETLGDILAGLLFEHSHNVGVQEIVLA
jgi:hypothetical protein